MENVQAKAKELCSVRSNIKVSKIDDAAMLKRLIDALPQATRIVFGDRDAA